MVMVVAMETEVTTAMDEVVVKVNSGVRNPGMSKRMRRKNQKKRKDKPRHQMIRVSSAIDVDKKVISPLDVEFV